MSTLLELAWKIAAPVASGAAGVAGTLWKITKNLEDRVRVLEKERLPPTESWIVTFTKDEYPSDLASLKKLVSDLKIDIDEELERFHDEIKGRDKEHREERRLQSKLASNYLSLLSRVSACESAASKLNDSFTQFAKGQQEQWQEISRALGNIEGWLRATNSRRTPGEFPAPKR